MSSQPKSSFWLAVWAVIFGLVGLAAWRAGMLEQFGLGRTTETARNVDRSISNTGATSNN